MRESCATAFLKWTGTEANSGKTWCRTYTNCGIALFLLHYVLFLMWPHWCLVIKQVTWYELFLCSARAIQSYNIYTNTCCVSRFLRNLLILSKLGTLRYVKVIEHFFGRMQCQIIRHWVSFGHTSWIPWNLSFHYNMYILFHEKKDSKQCRDTLTPESIHTKDESKRGSAFAFIFGVNWPVQLM